VSVRSRSGGDQGAKRLDEFIEAALLEVRSKKALEPAQAGS
jgi:hypothetical protein